MSLFSFGKRSEKKKEEKSQHKASIIQRTHNRKKKPRPTIGKKDYGKPGGSK